MFNDIATADNPLASGRGRTAFAVAFVIDWLVFSLGYSKGLEPAQASLISFAVASVLSGVFLLPTYLDAARPHTWRFDAAFLAIHLLAFFLRGGVLALCTAAGGWAPQTAMVFAILASTLVVRLGLGFCCAVRTRHDEPAYSRLLLLYLIVYCLALRLVYLGLPDLTPEEAYYWNYSRHLDIGYLDHPPMVAWLIRGGTALFGQTEFGVRVGAYVCWAVAAFFACRLTRNLFGKDAVLPALALMLVLPYFFLTGLMITPDSPLVAAWAAALYFSERALLGRSSAAWWGVGISIGLGLVSKYSIGLLAVSIAVFILFDPPSRRWLRRWEPYAAVLLALAIFSPVILWNEQNHWASFAFQTTGRLTQRVRFSTHKLLLAALVLLTPTGLWAAVRALRFSTPVTAAPTEAALAAQRLRFTRIFTLVPLAVFVAFSFRHQIKLDWVGPLWLAVLPSMAFRLIPAKSSAGLDARLLQRGWSTTILATILLLASGLYYLALGFPGVGYSDKMELAPVGWRELGRQLDTIQRSVSAQTGQRPLIVGMDRYFISSEAAFYRSDPEIAATESAGAYLFGQSSLMYERWLPAPAQQGRTLLLVAWTADPLTDPRIGSQADNLGPVRENILSRDGKTIRHYFYRVVYGYRPAPTAAS